MNKITIYHGSKNIIENPKYGLGNKHNDFGLGFYCTKNIDLAYEWACTKKYKGFANEYELEIDDLKILDITDEKYNVLNWLAILIENRNITLNEEIGLRGKDYLQKNFMPDYKKVDIIIGYRADDSYFSFCKAFLRNVITVEQLERAMLLGDLGKQVVIKSKKSFEKLKFIGASSADYNKYFARRLKRDDKAKNSYFNLINSQNNAIDGKYMIDIIREGWKDDGTFI